MGCCYWHGSRFSIPDETAEERLSQYLPKFVGAAHYGMDSGVKVRVPLIQSIQSLASPEQLAVDGMRRFLARSFCP